ncbi:sn-glycerol-3-phosphate ABC transporter ATP-binding protein UgpC [bacterium]|nr:sn-glycerol-3-phosphate ABC transporter ATP-binding protein UgpC [bacterium]
MATARLEGITKSFGDVEILHGIDCEIQNGEFIVILGPSGCGKSTLLRLIAGLEKITSGTIQIDDRIVNDLEPAERDIAMVFQTYALYPHMTIFNNMAYGLKIRKMSRAEIEKRVQKAAEILELTPLLKRKPKQLSGGQRQRVAMGRCIVREPKLFLFDEPLSNLDAKLRVQMRLEIRKLHHQLNITSIYVTHDQVEAMTLGDRLLVMDKGLTAQIGTPLDVYERPANIFVAGFIGSPSMNFMEAQLENDGRSIRISKNEALELPEKGLPEFNGKKVKVGLRPEHFIICDPKEAQINLVTDVVEKLGADTLVHGFSQESKIAMTARLDGIQHFNRDTVLPFRIQSNKLHIFDPDSGKRIN